ncbi:MULTISPECIES: SGNH/GDSL hydrolase family protein [unclassified Methylobacterium]|jgi:hypothetical protein|uniref:SGNH/GDSL hydrolase family protein n=1 Tax=unclassified Methylobacterium TaxID=2615210 RepID=UPI0013559A62|nr:SGNH/GDSL hydrolase family protein [Methylobacterium sp. 2A]MWV25210.1 hypothetical protein [Methylobacterium sp. 2A]
MNFASSRYDPFVTRTMMQHDAAVGTLYIPSLKLRVSGKTGGYLIRTNAAGFRSEREFTPKRTPGKLRAVMFGDSQTAGDGVSNAKRFSDLLEKKIPNFEVYNYGIHGTGPDQHYLLYDRLCNVQHDLLIIVTYVETIRRISRRVFESRGSDGSPVFYAKPYYEIVDDRLELRNVPVPKHIWSEQTLPEELKSHIYSAHETNLFTQVTGRKGSAPKLPRALEPLREIVKSGILRLPKFKMLHEYNNADHPSWVLLRSIMEQWIAASPTPVLLVTIPHYITFESGQDPTCYRTRFRELVNATSIRHYDFFADVKKLSTNDRRSLWSEWSGHLSAEAHELMAANLAPVIQSLLPDTRNEATA